MEGAKHALRNGAADTPFLEVRRLVCRHALLRCCSRVMTAEWQLAVRRRWSWSYIWELPADTHRQYVHLVHMPPQGIAFFVRTLPVGRASAVQAAVEALAAPHEPSQVRCLGPRCWDAWRDWRLQEHTAHGRTWP